jgi:ring-1,2-phenylacetyl-CoA epoxidase subunit PaaC
MMTTTVTYTSAGEVSGEVKAGIVDLLYRLADDDLVIGHRNSEWTGLAPILEADIAMSSIAQDQIGRSLAYYTLLGELGESAPDSLAFARGADGYRCCSLVSTERGDWAVSTCRQCFYDIYQANRIEASCESTYLPLAQLARKIRGEQKYHTMHSRMWLTGLGDATGESHTLMQGAVELLYPHALGLFEPTEHDEVIAASGLAPAEGDLCAQWRADTAELFGQAGLSIPDAAEAALGGRAGKHGAELADLLDGMQKVYRQDPTATW